MASSLIVFSHLRWDFVYQRPQHLMTRLSQDRRVIFFEEPVTNSERDYLESKQINSNLIVCRPHTRAAVGGFHDDQVPTLKAMLRDFLEDDHPGTYDVWFYSPMALPLMQELKPRKVIYDCMDELSAFRNAPRQLLQRESALLKVADLVFTGGPSLYEAKRDRHANVHCFSSSVDVEHFAKARDRSTSHELQSEIPGPRVGYIGVIDERIDLELVAGIAAQRPQWQLIMVGPRAKIDESSLPRAPNIHYLGQQAYESLPRFLAGWDVCLQPFALNEATRFISPTKTLEYMAALRPIVSTAVTDVVRPYGHVVRIAEGVRGFIEACETLLSQTPQQREAETRIMEEVLARTSWDDTARRMRDLIDAPAAAVKPMQTFSTGSADAQVTTFKYRDAQPATHYSTVILGAGPTGLSAAYHLGKGSVLLEQHSQIGGWCRSIEDNGFTFDYAGHIMFSNDPYVHELYAKLLGDNVHWQNREAWIYSNEVYTRYPFQSALYGLPADVLKDCIVGAIEARFGGLKTAKSAPASTCSSASVGKPESITDCCADGVAESTLGVPGSVRATVQQEPRNFEEFIYKVWGAGVAKHFAVPYNRKLWATPLREMETSWLGGRVPLPDLEEMIEGALRPVEKPIGPNARFGYPLRGGFQALMNGFAPLLKGDVRLDSKIVRVLPGRRTVVTAGGTHYRYEHLISTLPLPALIHMMRPEVPEHIVAAAAGLRHVSVRCVNLGIGREHVTGKHWIYYPGESVFHRIFVQGNASPHCNPPGGFGLTCEITYSPSKPLPCEGQGLIDRCIEDCIKVGLIRPDDSIWTANQIDMPYAYVVYDHARKQHVETIRAWLEPRGIILAGRYSEWEYYNSDHAFIAGKKAADAVNALHELATATEMLEGAS